MKLITLPLRNHEGIKQKQSPFHDLVSITSTQWGTVTSEGALPLGWGTPRVSSDQDRMEKTALLGSMGHIFPPTSAERGSWCQQQMLQASASLPQDLSAAALHCHLGEQI